MKIKYVMNEYEYIKDFINGKPLDSDDMCGIDRLIIMQKMYYKREFPNMSDSEIKDKILNRMMNFERTNCQEYQMSKIISAIISKNKSYNLKEFEYIPLYEAELEKIKKLSNDREKKFMFTCYILSHFYNSEWVNVPYNELFKLANIGLTGDDRLMFIHHMFEMGYIGMSKKVTNLSLKVDSEKEGKIVMKVDSIDKLGNKILAFLSPNKITCQKCGRVVNIKTSHDGSSKYCGKCAREVFNSQKLEWWNNNRK